MFQVVKLYILGKSKSEYYNKVKVPTPVFISDLVNLNEKQLNILGIQSKGSHYKSEDVHYRSFKKSNKKFYLVSKKIINIYLFLGILLKHFKKLLYKIYKK